MAFSEHIAHIEGVLGYHFTRPALLEQAFRRESFCNEVKQTGGPDLPSYQVLELVGDNILCIAVTTLLVRDFGEIGEAGLISSLDEGGLTVIKSRLTDKTAFSAALSRTDLSNYMLLGRGDRMSGIATLPSVREDLFEAIFGAIWLDCYDFERITAVLSRFLDRRALRSLFQKSTKSPSAKNAVQEWCARPENRGATVEYPDLAESGPDHDKRYTVACRVTLPDGRVLETDATAKTKKAAALYAATEMLALLAQE